MSQATIKTRLEGIEITIEALEALKKFKVDRSVKSYIYRLNYFFDYHKVWLDGSDIDLEAIAICNLIDEIIVYYEEERDLNGVYMSSETLDVFQNGLLEPNGFPNLSKDSDISFDDVTRTFTIAPKIDEFVLFQLGIKYVKTETETLQISDDMGIHVIYYDNGVLVDHYVFNIHDVYNIIEGKVIVAYVGWRSDLQESVYFADERHGSQMDSLTHRYLHFAFGTRYISGAGLGDIIADDDGSLDSSAQFSIAFGTAFDEDIAFHGMPYSSTSGLPIYYLTGAGLINKVDNGAFSMLTTGSGRLAYNKWDGVEHTVEEVPNKGYAMVHIFLTNDINNPYIARMGNAYYTSERLAQDGAYNEIKTLFTNETIFQESVTIATIILKTDNGFTNGVKSIIVSTDEGGDYIDWRESDMSGSSMSSDHGNLGGLLDDDHRQYTLVDGLTTGMTAFITDNLDGTIDIAQALVSLFDNPNKTGRIIQYTVPSIENLALADLILSYVIVNYNSGVPIYTVTTDVSIINESDIVPIITVFRNGTVLEFIKWDKTSTNQIHTRMVKTHRFEYESGLVLSEKNTREIELTEGKTWHGTTQVTNLAIDTLSDNLTWWYHVGGVWTPATRTQYINDFYDDGTDIVALSNNQYVVNWIYRSQTENKRLGIVVGGTHKNIVSANAETIPETPVQISALGILVGRIIVMKGEDTASEIQSAFKQEFYGYINQYTTVNNIIEDVTTARTLSITDASKYIRMSNVGLITLTVPLESVVNFEIGTEIEFEQGLTGAIEFVGDIGVTINSFDSSYITAGQYATVSIKKIASDTWVINGLLV